MIWRDVELTLNGYMRYELCLLFAALLGIYRDGAPNAMFANEFQRAMEHPMPRFANKIREHPIPKTPPPRVCYIKPVAPVAYQVILEPGIGQFRESEPRRVHTRINSLGLFLVHNLSCGKRESVSKQHSMKNRRAVGLLNPICAIKIEGKTRGEEGKTLVTTACPEAGK